MHEPLWLTLITAVALDFAVLRLGVSWNRRRALGAAALLNTLAFIALAGFFVLPVSELFVWGLILPILAKPTPIAWALATAVFAIWNMTIKWPLIIALFRPQCRCRIFKLLFIANLLSAAFFVATLWYADRTPPIPQHEIAWLEAEYAQEIAFLHARVEEMEHLGFAPWRDPNWSRRMKAEASGHRFRWLELRHTRHERFALVEFNHKQTAFPAQVKKEHRWILRGEDKDHRYYRYIVSNLIGKAGLLEAVGDFVTPAN